MLLDTFTLFEACSNNEINWKMVFFGKIIGSKIIFLSISKLLNVYLYNLKYKKLTDSKNCFKDAKKDLFCKFVL